MTLLVGQQVGHPACKKLNGGWWGAGVVMCLERGADLHMAQLMPLLLTVSCFSKIQTGFTFVVPAHPGCPGQIAVKRVCVRGVHGNGEDWDPMGFPWEWELRRGSCHQKLQTVFCSYIVTWSKGSNAGGATA